MLISKGKAYNVGKIPNMQKQVDCMCVHYNGILSGIRYKRNLLKEYKIIAASVEGTVKGECCCLKRE